jgi:propionate CoA-transferase
MVKFINAKEAANLINDGSAVAISSFTAISMAEDIIVAIEKKFIHEHHPNDLFIFHISGVGDYKKRGLSHFSHEGLIKTIVGSHVFASPGIIPLIDENKIASYCLPQGVASHLTRSMAGGEDGLLTKIGLNTFADPRQDGCKMNNACDKDIVDLIKIGNKEYLFYRSFKFDFCLLKGSIADEDGNISFENEPVLLEQLELAAATKVSGGKVIVQVHKKVKNKELNPRNIKIPAHFVDYIVIGSKENTFQTHLFKEYHPELTGEERIDLESIPPKPLDIRKVCGRRGVFEIKKDFLVNIGGGFSESVASVAAEEGIDDQFLFSVESGIIGGVPVEGGIGLSYNPDVILRQPESFDLYNGGCLDMSFLGCAQIDEKGNVNVSKFAGKIIGPGGFINITQNTKNICFLGSFTSGKSEIIVNNGNLQIIKDGNVKKFVKKVEQITFSGIDAIKRKQNILYITERCVFHLSEEGLVLIEIAPSIDIKKDILDKMEFVPIISKNIKTMDIRIFKKDKMNIKNLIF